MSETTSPRQSERVDELLSVLADGERRVILAYLQDDPNRTASLKTLAAVLAHDSATDQDRARIQLHHTHLPALDRTPLLNYEAETRTVEYHGHPALDSLLETIERYEAAHAGQAL